jgi:hypothetical protein
MKHRWIYRLEALIRIVAATTVAASVNLLTNKNSLVDNRGAAS